MFIAVDEKNKVYREEMPAGFNWTMIPKVKLVQLQLTFPFRVKLLEKDGKAAREFAPLISLGKYDAYYFMNEAVVRFANGKPEPQLEAKIIAGIDKQKDLVFECRLDKLGNISLRNFTYSSLKEKIAKGLFSESIIKPGA